MRLAMFGAVAGLLLAATPATAQTADVLAPARTGQLQCFEPNAAAKTCQSIGGYNFETGGAIINAAQILIAPEPVVVMSVNSPVIVRGGAICGPLRAADIASASFTVNGAPASADEARNIRAAMNEQLSPLFDLESCMTLTPDGDVLRAESSIAGTPQPQLTQRVIWIGANDGWRVAP